MLVEYRVQTAFEIATDQSFQPPDVDRIDVDEFGAESLQRPSNERVVGEFRIVDRSNVQQANTGEWLIHTTVQENL